MNNNKKKHIFSYDIFLIIIEENKYICADRFILSELVKVI